MEERDEREEFFRALRRELDVQAEQLKVRKVIARRADGVCEALNIIQTLTDNGITVYVEAPRTEVETLRELLKQSKRSHYYCEDPWYSCPKAEEGCADDSKEDVCDCGAEDWNAKVDAALSPQREPGE